MKYAQACNESPSHVLQLLAEMRRSQKTMDAVPGLAKLSIVNNANAKLSAELPALPDPSNIGNPSKTVMLKRRNAVANSHVLLLVVPRACRYRLHIPLLQKPVIFVEIISSFWTGVLALFGFNYIICLRTLSGF